MWPKRQRDSATRLGKRHSASQHIVILCCSSVTGITHAVLGGFSVFLLHLFDFSIHIFSVFRSLLFFTRSSFKSLTYFCLHRWFMPFVQFSYRTFMFGLPSALVFEEKLTELVRRIACTSRHQTVVRAPSIILRLTLFDRDTFMFSCLLCFKVAG